MNNYRILILVILLLSFTLRINRLDYPLSGTFAWGDGTRDYLVASHIIKFGELPTIGPYNLLDGSGIKSSPVYFYLLALPLLIYNHPLTLGVVNIFLQMMVLGLIFLITKTVFGKTSALVAIILLGVNPEAIKQSDYIWQPHLMMLMTFLSLYCLLKAYLNKNYLLLFFSSFTISLAFAIHHSAFPWLAVILAVSFFILIKNHQYLKFVGLIMLVSLTLIILYLPVILSSAGIKNLPTQSLSGFLNNLSVNLEAIAKLFYINKLLFILMFGLATLLSKCNPLIILAAVLFLLPLASASFFNKIRVHYLILSSVMFVVLVSSLLDYLKPKAYQLLFLFLLVWIFSGNFQFIRDYKRPFENLKLIDQITEKVVVNLDQIKKEENFTEYDFFQVKSYAKDEDIFDYPVLDTLLLVPLEMRLKTKLAKKADESSFNHIQINRKDYLVLSCLNPKQYRSVGCAELFLKKENYYIIKTLYASQDISIYLAKQNMLLKTIEETGIVTK